MEILNLPSLNIGCGASPMPKEEGWINCDLEEGPNVDCVFDCQGRWPFNDNSIREVHASHTLEHLNDFMGFFREAWRVLMPNGQLTIRVPYGWHSAAWWDPTHLRPWTQESFAFLQPGYQKFSKNLVERNLNFAFWVENAVMVLALPWARYWRFRFLRRIIFNLSHYLLNSYKELHIRAFKTIPDDPQSAGFGGPRHPCIVNCSVGVWEHELLNRKLTGAVACLLVFGVPGASAGY